MSFARIAGTGRHVPEHLYDTEFMLGFAGNPRKWSPEQFERLTGIRERRFAIRLNNNTGLPLETNTDLGFAEIEMAVDAAKIALDDSGYTPEEVELLIFVSCTAQNGARMHFGASAHEVHHRLKLSPEAKVREMDAGCGGAVHAIDDAIDMIIAKTRKVALVVASNQPSQYMNRELYKKTDAWLASLIFGDGAAAVVLDNKVNGAGFQARSLSVDSGLHLMEMRSPPDEDTLERAYFINGKLVKRAFGQCLSSELAKLFALMPTARNADLFLFHQVNAKVLEQFVRDEDIPHDRVPMHSGTRGNIAAAATLDLLDEARKTSRVGQGDLIVIGAVGAGAQTGALAVVL